MDKLKDPDKGQKNITEGAFRSKHEGVKAIPNLLGGNTLLLISMGGNQLPGMGVQNTTTIIEPV